MNSPPMSGMAQSTDRGHRIAPNALARLIGPFWTAERTERALGPRTLSQLRRDREVLVVSTSEGVEIYPMAQFELYEDEVRVRPRLREWFGVLRHLEDWTVAALLFTPAPELHHFTPLDFARENRDDADATQLLLDYGRALAAEFAATP